MAVEAPDLATLARHSASRSLEAAVGTPRRHLHQQAFDGTPSTYRRSARFEVEQRVSGAQLGNFNKWRLIGAVLAGDWDRTKYTFEDNCFFRGLPEHFEDGVAWPETVWVKELTALTAQSQLSWHKARSLEEILRRCEKVDRLYASIRTQGYKTRDELHPSPSLVTLLDEITVNIARDGTFLHNTGVHRLAIAKLLRLEAIPVRIIVRREEWQRRREELATRPLAEPSSSTQALLDHPDLADVILRRNGKSLRKLSRLALVSAMAALVGCAGDRERSRAASGASSADSSVAVVGEAFFTPSTPEDNLDSPAVWIGPDAEWLIVTAKSSNVLAVFDARTGRPLRRVGGEGDEPGRFRRPNGLAVVGDLLLVVERNGGRVQALTLPDFRPRTTFGEELLHKPYGIAAFKAATGAIEVYVTDQHPDDPGQRVKHFRLQVAGSGLTPVWVRSFGATAGEGMLHKVESLLADPVHDRLLIADERTRTLKVYTLAGEYSGQQVGTGVFNHEPEGIALYACDDEGYLIAADQDATRNTFHVFDRRTLEHLGTFRGRQIASTDGVALTQQQLGSIRRGVLFAHHDDYSVGAIQWSEIAQALELRSDCNTPAP